MKYNIKIPVAILCHLKSNVWKKTRLLKPEMNVV